MDKTTLYGRVSANTLQKKRSTLLQNLQLPTNFMKASIVEQYLTCGKINCRCRRGFKHGPFLYLVQALAKGRIHKFLLKTPEQRNQARASLAATKKFQRLIARLSRINTEFLRRGEHRVGMPKPKKAL